MIATTGDAAAARGFAHWVVKAEELLGVEVKVLQAPIITATSDEQRVLDHQPHHALPFPFSLMIIF